MQTLTDLLTECLEETKDSSDDNKVRAIRRMNRFQKLLCAGASYPWLETTYSKASEASVYSYDLPADCRKVKSITVTKDTYTYHLTEVISDVEFESRYIQRELVTSNLPTEYNISGGKFRIGATPSDTTLTFTVTYLKQVKDLALEDYNTGSVTVTNGSKSVTGSGTTWNSTNCKAGSYIIIDGIPYVIQSRSSSTALVLVNKYQGTSASGVTYKIGDASVIPEEFSDILWLQYCETYYRKMQDEEQADYYKNLRMEIEARLKDSSMEESTSRVIKPRMKRTGFDINLYPTIT
jgi:hypothetical protein